ncbi:MAG: GyrI-like domain-containing protein [Lachnospiraceae bacterium]|nr:GyrI-like domain-containing protein [Lachnospiraceae bacterium]MBQ5850948.1 GyrI-like domain-containing protein [Lachnospiraceae bacterium]
MNSEWLPGNSDYEIAGMYNIEYYTAPNDYPNGNQDENYYCEIWMPVKSKNIGFLVKNQCVNSNEILTDYFLLNNNN